MAVKYTSYDDVYKAYAWRDNRRRLVVTQGEGLSSSSTDSNTYIKTAKFQLRDEQGAIELPSSTTAVSLALKKPNGMEVLVSAFYNYTDSATTKSEDRENGIVYFAITQSMTDIAGEVSGEIRLTTSTGVIKFYGINFYVYDGVSSNAAIQSNDFDHLVNALNKVEAVTGGGTIATLDSVIEHGGLHPVVSGVIYDFVDGNYMRYQSISGSEADTANDARTIYIHHANGGFQGFVFFTGYNNYNGSTTVRQFRLCKNGRFEYRTGTVNTPVDNPNTYTWDKTSNEDWKPIGSTQNIQDLAVTTAKLANGAVTSAKIGTGEVKTANIDSNAVTTAKIADGNVTSAKIGIGQVKTTNIEDESVTPEKLSKSYVETSRKIANIDLQSDISIPALATALKSRLMRFVYAHESGSEPYNDGDYEGVHINNATDFKTCYMYKNSSNLAIGIMFCTTVEAGVNPEITQYRFLNNGEISYRHSSVQNGSRVWDAQWTKIENTSNKVNSLSNNSTDDQYPTAKTVYDAIIGCEQYKDLGNSYVNNSANHLDGNTVYKYGDGFVIQANGSTSETQYYFASDGKLRYRTRTKTGGVWNDWVDQYHFSVLETKDNKTATIDSSSTDDQYPTAKAVYDNTMKFATITSTQLFDADTHLDSQTIYRYGTQGLILAANDSGRETQYYFAQDGIMRYRYRVKSGNVWGDWVDGNNFYGMINQEDIGQLLSPQNKLDKYFVKTCIDKTKVRLTQKTRILGFGDSIMNRGYGGSWMDVVQERTGCNIPINKSVGGAQFAVNSGSNTLASQLSSFHNSVNNNTLVDADNHAVDISEINLIVVAGGTNDAYNGIPINNFKTAVDTFFDDLKSEFEDRDMNCPPVLVITPIRRGKESEINAPGNKNLENKIAKYSAVINNLALQYGFSVLNGFDIPVLVDDMTIKGVGSETATISSFMYKTADSGDAYDDILHVHPNPTSGRSTYAQAVINAIGFEPIHSSVFSYTLLRNSWNNSQQSISVPASYVVTGDAIADTEIDNTAYNQLCADGCYGIYVASSTSGNSLILTAHALGNTPTADVTIQVTLTAVNDLSQ